MLCARVIPCLDVKDGRVVKGVNFVDLRDAGDPVEQARVYDGAGADELCFLDITASHEKHDILLDVVARTAEVCFMPLTVGGGVRTLDDIRTLLLAGADKVAMNTAAVDDPELVRAGAEKFGSQCIVVAVDAKRDGVLQGVNVEATADLARATDVPVIASGGVADLADIEALMAAASDGIQGAIIGRALYDGRIDAAAALDLVTAAERAEA
jgi:imidazole glycerol phosphate synthase subunit HisF